MTDNKQAAIEAFQRIADHLAWRSNDELNKDYNIVINALQSKPVDVDIEKLKEQAREIAYAEGYEGFEGSFGRASDAVIDFVHAKGYLNTPQKEDTE